MARHYYIGQFTTMDNTGKGDLAWCAPGADTGDCEGLFDWRSTPQRRLFAGQQPAEGYALFTYEGPRNYPELLLDLGSDLQANTRLVQRSGIETLLGKRVATTGVLEIIRELLMVHGDPDGLTGWNPLRTSRKAGSMFILGGQTLFHEAFSEAHPTFQNTIDSFRSAYRRRVTEGDSERNLRKWTGNEMRKLYGRMGDDLKGLIPAEYESIGWEKPATSFSDDFNRADEELGDSADWTEVAGDNEIVSNQVRVNGTTNPHSRAETVLSNDGHFAQAECAAAVTDTSFTGTGVRFAASADTFFWGGHRNSATITYLTQEFDAGSATNVDTINATAPGSGFITDKFDLTELDAYTLTSGGTDRATGTNTHGTGNVRGGIIGESTGTDRCLWDDFTEDDGVSAAGAIRHSLGLLGVGR